MRISDSYHKYYEGAKLWKKNSWLGEPCWKLPMDAFVIQELIFNLKPDFVIETGTGHGGSALFYASIMELIGHGEVITCDIEMKHKLDEHPLRNITERISFFEGSSTDTWILKQIKELVGETRKNIVILDSWHTCEHVLVEMGAYEAFVGEGYYMIVEDTHAGKIAHPILWEYDNDGPYEAVKFFLEENKDFVTDYDCEKHIMTFNPSGYLRRIK